MNGIYERVDRLEKGFGTVQKLWTEINGHLFEIKNRLKNIESDVSELKSDVSEIKAILREKL